jgi:hypothetical protein
MTTLEYCTVKSEITVMYRRICIVRSIVRNPLCIVLLYIKFGLCVLRYGVWPLWGTVYCRTQICSTISTWITMSTVFKSMVICFENDSVARYWSTVLYILKCAGCNTHRICRRSCYRNKNSHKEVLYSVYWRSKYFTTSDIKSPCCEYCLHTYSDQ